MLQTVIDWAIQNIFAPLIVEALVQFMERRGADPEFLKKSDALFSKIGAASTLDERRESAKELQSLIAS